MEKKAPIYIGIFAADDKESKKKVREYTLGCLKSIYSKYPLPQIEADINNFDTTFSYPKDVLHITTLFIGNKPLDKLSERDRANYKQFQVGEKQTINCDGLLYVPGYLICAVCCCPIPCANEYPHMTMFLSKQAKPVESNDICTEFFKEQPALFKSREFAVMHHHNDKVPKHIQNIYLCGEKLQLEGVCRGP